jgi:hypothetical protein
VGFRSDAAGRRRRRWGRGARMAWSIRVSAERPRPLLETSAPPGGRGASAWAGAARRCLAGPPAPGRRRVILDCTPSRITASGRGRVLATKRDLNPCARDCDWRLRSRPGQTLLDSATPRCGGRTQPVAGSPRAPVWRPRSPRSSPRGAGARGRCLRSRRSPGARPHRGRRSAAAPTRPGRWWGGATELRPHSREGEQGNDRPWHPLQPAPGTTQRTHRYQGLWQIGSPPQRKPPHAASIGFSIRRIDLVRQASRLLAASLPSRASAPEVSVSAGRRRTEVLPAKIALQTSGFATLSLTEEVYVRWGA